MSGYLMHRAYKYIRRERGKNGKYYYVYPDKTSNGKPDGNPGGQGERLPGGRSKLAEKVAIANGVGVSHDREAILKGERLKKKKFSTTSKNQKEAEDYKNNKRVKIASSDEARKQRNKHNEFVSKKIAKDQRKGMDGLSVGAKAGLHGNIIKNVINHDKEKEKEEKKGTYLKNTSKRLKKKSDSKRTFLKRKRLP